MEQNQKRGPVIKCPHCGYEYVPAEIFMPGDFLGKPTDLIRDPLGKFLYIEYEKDNEPSQTESYVCDSCDKPFIVEPVVSYKVKKEVEELDFTEDYVSLL
jgi:DNA-directed RNA polymerase subunit RPC12/RpoP